MGETGSTSGFMSAIAWPLTIETERLILRSHQPSDYDAWRAGFAGRLPQQSPYDEGPVDLAGCDADWFVGLCERHHAQASRDDAYIFGVFSRLTHQQLGHVDLATLQREEKQWANLGYSIHNQHWRQGFGQEAVSAALKAGFETLGYHRIEAAINLDNHASIALAQAVGLQRECLRRGFYYEDDQWVDHLIYVALPTDLGLREKPPEIAL